MKKTIFLSTLLLYFLVGNGLLLGQKVFNGTVSDQATNSPLPYAHVYLKTNNSVGTISNSEGKFTITLPKDAAYDSIVASYIGFKSSVISLERVLSEKNFVFRLEESPNLLKEIVINAKDTLSIFLTAAYNKIPLNYPTKDFLIRGFYRETNFVEPQNKFIYFSEANIEFYSRSYSNANSKYGSVRILEGGKFEVKDRFLFSNIYFYAGVYSAQRLDFVKERIEFIQPRHFIDYSYVVDGLIEYEGRPTVIISFEPRKDALYEGTLFIDKQTLAYVKCNYKLSKVGLKKEKSGNLSSFDYKDRSFQVQFKLKGEKWHLLFVIQDGKGLNKKYSNELRYTNEFVVLSEEIADKNPIPDSEAVPFYAFYTSQDKKFNDDYWEKQEVISRTEKLDSTISLLFQSGSSSHAIVLKDSTELGQKNKVTFKSKLVKISSSISNGISFASIPLKHNIGNYEISYSNLFSIKREFKDSPMVNSLGVDFKYYLNMNSCIIFQAYGSIGGSTNIALLSIGGQYSKRLMGWKRPLYAEVGLHIYQATYEIKMGTLFPNNSFKADGINFNPSDELVIGLGENRWGLLGSLELIYKLHSRFSLFTKTSVSLFSYQNHNLFIHKKKNAFLNLIKKTATVDLGSNNVMLTRDNIKTTESPITFNSIQFAFNLGIRFGLNR